MYVYHTNVFEADNIYKNPPPNIFLCYFYFALGSTHDSADCWSAYSSNVCTTDARPGGVGRVAPQQKSWLRLAYMSKYNQLQILLLSAFPIRGRHSRFSINFCQTPSSLYLQHVLLHQNTHSCVFPVCGEMLMIFRIK